MTDTLPLLVLTPRRGDGVGRLAKDRHGRLWREFRLDAACPRCSSCGEQAGDGWAPAFEASLRGSVAPERGVWVCSACVAPENGMLPSGPGTEPYVGEW